MQKRPVSINFSKRVLDRIDKEARARKRSRSEYVDMHFEELFFKEEQPLEIAIKTG
jgi:metal-responsive CopG/Arc/MetJ family transcriptional regulator